MKILNAGIIFVAGLLLLILVGLLWPYNIIKIDKIDLLTPSINAGEEVLFEVHFCKYMDVRADVVSEIISIDQENQTREEIVWLTRKASGAGEPRCGAGTVNIPTPKSLPTGTYQIKTTLHYQVNPIRMIDVEYITPSFYISNP